MNEAIKMFQDSFNHARKSQFDGKTIFDKAYGNDSHLIVGFAKHSAWVELVKASGEDFTVGFPYKDFLLTNGQYCHRSLLARIVNCIMILTFDHVTGR
jgi:hypothetical protein